ncbi:hypothetical protein [Streptomyces sp. NBC_00120]|uniref:hypothetical protein n=1 Tax=Streptomyces sp. NBC_00120 TaxID=2975660 RepID=UPI00224E82D3|nr:hypothetical protein [Streptomyces sp. NBC_00120]MCX5326292.1 hypothetical protein [Streptomyces sp. NBC_00120]
MQPQTPAKTTRTKAAAPAAAKVTASAVTALQGRVARVVGSGALDSAPFSYHH